jgi:hypothetical protein
MSDLVVVVIRLDLMAESTTTTLGVRSVSRRGKSFFWCLPRYMIHERSKVELVCVCVCVCI